MSTFLYILESLFVCVCGVCVCGCVCVGVHVWGCLCVGVSGVPCSVCMCLILRVCFQSEGMC